MRWPGLCLSSFQFFQSEGNQSVLGACSAVGSEVEITFTYAGNA
jgi:hypothetical protein